MLRRGWPRFPQHFGSESDQSLMRVRWEHSGIRWMWYNSPWPCLYAITWRLVLLLFSSAEWELRKSPTTIVEGCVLQKGSPRFVLALTASFGIRVFQRQARGERGRSEKKTVYIYIYIQPPRAASGRYRHSSSNVYKDPHVHFADVFRPYSVCQRC